VWTYRGAEEDAMQRQTQTAQLYRAAGAVVGMCALGIMFYTVLVGPKPGGLPMAIGNFFSYFTVQSSILATLAFGSAWLAPHSRLGQFFSRPATRAAIALYIAVVGAVYFLILRHTWQPEGLRWLADALLHYAMPVLFILDWLLFVPRGGLRWGDVASWLVFPLAYAAYTLARGAAFGWYPYPFIDVTALGYAGALTNMAVLVGVFALLGLVTVPLDGWLGRARARHAVA
jgi:hypothetical protein